MYHLGLIFSNCILSIHLAIIIKQFYISINHFINLPNRACIILFPFDHMHYGGLETLGGDKNKYYMKNLKTLRGDIDKSHRRIHNPHTVSWSKLYFL